jgi:hypothetical protein
VSECESVSEYVCFSVCISMCVWVHYPPLTNRINHLNTTTRHSPSFTPQAKMTRTLGVLKVSSLPPRYAELSSFIALNCSKKIENFLVEVSMGFYFFKLDVTVVNVLVSVFAFVLVFAIVLV